MRVIAGTYRHRLLKEADQSATRPTTDKNREMVFNVLGQFFDGGTALDLFAGTGAMGIEALSRGIRTAVFVDADRTAVATIRVNLAALAVGPDRAEVLKTDADAFLAANGSRRFDLVFLDPPYADAAVPAALGTIAATRMLSADGTIVAESDRNFTNQRNIGGLALMREIPAGHSKFAFYRWGDNP